MSSDDIPSAADNKVVDGCKDGVWYGVSHFGGCVAHNLPLSCDDVFIRLGG